MRDTSHASRPRRRLRREIRWTITALLLLLVVEYLFIPELAGASKSLHDLAQVNVAYLILAFLLEAASLVAYAQLTQTVLPSGGPSRWRLLRINTSTLAVSHVVPGGTAPGTGLAYRLLTDSGVQGADAAFGLAMQGVGSAVVLNLIFWVALVVSIFRHGYNPLYGAAAGVGVLLMAAFAGIVVLLLRGRHWAVELVRRLANRLPALNGEKLATAVERIADRLRALLEERPLLVRAVSWAAANWLLDAASLWVFIVAFHKVVSPIDLLVAYGLANVLAVIPITPGGLGIVEGVLIPTLHGFGVAKPVAVLSVLSYRLVNFWLPIPVGGASYLSLRFSTGDDWRQHLAAARDEVVNHPAYQTREASVPGAVGTAGTAATDRTGSQ
ncbi:MAG: lysylphosphatidylglycerol synthase transmembrane domain-containing protein [Acidimicrobiales bacterium]